MVWNFPRAINCLHIKYNFHTLNKSFELISVTVLFSKIVFIFELIQLY